MCSPTVRAIPIMRVPSLNFPKCIKYSSFFFSNPAKEKATPLSTRAAFEALCSSCVVRYLYS